MDQDKRPDMDGWINIARYVCRRFTSLVYIQPHIYTQRFCPCRLLEYRVTFYIQVHFYCAVSQYFFLFNHICEWRVKFFAPHLTLKVRHLIMMEKIQVLVLWPLTKTNEMMVTLNGPYGCNFKYTAYL